MSLLAECYRRLRDSSSSQQPLKGYKVTDVNRTRKIGVACRNLQDLKQKACAKFNIMDDLALIGIFLIDGSEIDDEYFATVEPQTTLILCRPGEQLLTEADILYQMLRKANESLFQQGEKAAEFLTDKLKINIATLNKILNKDDKKTMFSKREDHPEWFDGLETNSQTKEAYLHRRCQDRIRGYLYKTISQIRSSEIFTRDPKARKQLQLVITYFKLQLRKDHYFGYYFDRSRSIESAAASGGRSQSGDDTDGPQRCCYDHCVCKLSISDYERYILGLDKDEVDAKKMRLSGSTTDTKNENLHPSNEENEDLQVILKKCPYKFIQREEKDMVALCDVTGEFSCSGVWNLNKCLYDEKHKINPYRSKEELILFSTWNLDHRIERSRTLVPQLLEASKQEKIDEKDVLEFYDNLFTLKNLRLVHIVCHDKGSHK
ncbi:PREDICTED: DNA fragmentation factor subunit beta [Ceratosolen solmsi marchali]|uniref:DNAation factor subunit beta n=1 Tax=Ceratosolen solmsi marchali TaxID=326594 RepID=A0AAJ6VN71_9HYME|nr:PREDICTED: DNA fragmentation factor subunit beta [Ceratosolen solmsi marchali]